MKYFLNLFILLFAFMVTNAQTIQTHIKHDTTYKSLRTALKESPKAPHNWYKLYNLKRDTIFVDTSLTVHSDYKNNFLRKDSFGLLSFANDGQTYTVLDHSLLKIKSSPSFGFKGKQFNYISAEDIHYFQVPTPLSDLYFKTVLEQGQNLDAFITLNTSKSLNFSIAYKGLRSLGKYQNDLASIGNFRFTSSYLSSNKSYGFNFHFSSQDLTNYENGGILNLNDFNSGDNQFKQRSRLDVILTDAKSVFEGKRFFIDQFVKLNKSKWTAIHLEHQFNYEALSYSFEKNTDTNYFGSAYKNSNFSDKILLNQIYNKIGASLSLSSYGRLGGFVEDTRYQTTYNRIVVQDNGVVIPSQRILNMYHFGAKYWFSKEKWAGEALISKSASKQTASTLHLWAKYSPNKDTFFYVYYSNLSKVPDFHHTLYQSDFVAYNWYNSFKNEKINTLKFNATTQWLSAEAQFSVLNDHIYFSNDDVTGKTLLTTPKQYDGTINYMSIKAQKEFKFRKWALDNTFLFQQVGQDETILNTPKFVTRNTLYFSEYLFKRALFLQTGVTFQYFSKYHVNGFNPLINDFYVQNKITIGNYPLIDFFINARIQQTRIFLKAEHLNSSFTGYNFYSAPNHPYKDFVIRFGITWNFFQ